MKPSLHQSFTKEDAAYRSQRVCVLSSIYQRQAYDRVQEQAPEVIQKLCNVSQLPREGELKAFVGEAGLVALCVGVVDGMPYAIDNACPHARAQLAGGHLAGGNVVCPLHGWQWNITSGEPVHVGDPAVQTYEIRQYGAEVFVRLPNERMRQTSIENKG